MPLRLPNCAPQSGRILPDWLLVHHGTTDICPAPAAHRGAASSGRGGGTVAASFCRGAIPLKEGFLMRNTLSSTSSTALSGVDAPLVTPAANNH